MKRCTDCKEYKFLNEFNKNKSKDDGLGTECRSCTKKYNKFWRTNNSEKVKKDKRKWQINNREKFKKYALNWKKTHSEVYEKNQKLGRERRKLASLGIYQNDVYKMQKKTTVEGKFLDHIIPIAGKIVCGLNVPWNMQVLDYWSNRYKSNWFDNAVYQEWRKNSTGPLLRPKSETM